VSTEPFHLLPIFLEIDGVPVMLVEVSKQNPVFGDPYYIASVRIHYKGIVSKVFPLQVKDETDLKNKLKVEITKIKFIELMYGLEEVRRLIA